LATRIRIYVETAEEAGLQPHDFNLPDFGGQLPTPGDLILAPQSEGGADGRTVWEVVCRYHDPGVAYDGGAILRLKAIGRPATRPELELFNDR
jgi:hypothetical protein